MHFQSGNVIPHGRLALAFPLAFDFAFAFAFATALGAAFAFAIALDVAAFAFAFGRGGGAEDRLCELEAELEAEELISVAFLLDDAPPPDMAYFEVYSSHLLVYNAFDFRYKDAAAWFSGSEKFGSVSREDIESITFCSDSAGDHDDLRTSRQISPRSFTFGWKICV